MSKNMKYEHITCTLYALKTQENGIYNRLKVDDKKFWWARVRVCVWWLWHHRTTEGQTTTLSAKLLEFAAPVTTTKSQKTYFRIIIAY